MEDEAEKQRRKREMRRLDTNDERNAFLYELPMLAPKDFVPSKKYRKKCKICYEAKIDTVLMDCKHSLFCEACSKYLQATCPLCGEEIERVVKICDIGKFLFRRRQL